MESIPRHQCLLYKGAPSLQLPMLAQLTRQRLELNYRCLYLNSPPMVAGMRSYLAAAGVDVAGETARESLVMSAEQSHLIDGKTFSVDLLMTDLESALDEALKAGYAGLWATGDMTWELGPEIGSGKLLEYEWRLENFFRAHPEMNGICQYHIDTLPRITVNQGLSAHPAVFVNETLSRINPHYFPPEEFAGKRLDNPALESFVDELSRYSVA